MAASRSQCGSQAGLPTPTVRRGDLVTPNPNPRLLDQGREVIQLKHYSTGTERGYCDWIRHYIQFRQAGFPR